MFTTAGSLSFELVPLVREEKKCCGRSETSRAHANQGFYERQTEHAVLNDLAPLAPLGCLVDLEEQFMVRVDQFFIRPSFRTSTICLNQCRHRLPCARECRGLGFGYATGLLLPPRPALLRSIASKSSMLLFSILTSPTRCQARVGSGCRQLAVGSSRSGTDIPSGLLRASPHLLKLVAAEAADGGLRLDCFGAVGAFLGVGRDADTTTFCTARRL